MKNNYTSVILLLALLFVFSCDHKNENSGNNSPNKKKRTLEEKAEDTQERYLYEYNLQKNPKTDIIPQDEKKLEFENSILAKEQSLLAKVNSNSYSSRGPSNLGGRTRSVKIDISDPTGNTMISGGVSSGVFRTTNGGNSWSKVSSNSDIHNATVIAQDPREGNQNIWYYGTGEFSGNSAGLGGNYLGNGIWKSTDGGLTWQQLPETNSGVFGTYDNSFDIIIDMQVHPITGELFASTADRIYRFTENGPVVELQMENNNTGWTDIVITSTGRVFAAIETINGLDRGIVWTSSTGSGSWNPIASSSSPSGWRSNGRVTLAVAPSNEDILYVLYRNNQSNNSNNRVTEADLWQYQLSSGNWTNFTSKLPDEPGSDSDGNDPFSIQGGYDLVIAVKPDNENFVVIGGTNIYKIEDITVDAMFKRIGGYAGPGGYALYSEGGVEHHPDIHAIEWDINDTNTLYSGTDGGVHKTTNLNTNFVRWINLNNNYLTYQYYHINMINDEGDDYVIGGAQDNGTTIGGFSASRNDKSSMTNYFGGDGAAVAVAKSTQGLGLDYVTYVSTQRGRMLRGNNTQVTTVITPIESNDTNGNPIFYPSQFVTYFYMDQDNPSTIYYAGNSNLVRTNDAENVTSDSWTLLGSLPFSERINTIEASKGIYNSTSSFILIGGRGGNIYKLDDPQNATDLGSLKKITPSGINTNALNINSGQYTSDIAIHPNNPDVAIITYSSYGSDIRNIYITNNLSASVPTWTSVEGNLESHSVRAAAIAEVNNQTVYFVGTARGLYMSSDPTSIDWSLESPNLIGLSVVSGLVYRNSDNILLVGTHGNGMFEANLNETLSNENIEIDQLSIAMYPNPSMLKLNFISKDFNLDETTNFKVFDMTGKQVLKGNLRDKSVDISSLESGVYSINLNNQNYKVSKRFVKN